MEKQLTDIIDCIDRTLGEGYARKNPELIGRMMQAQSMAVAAAVIQDGLYAIGFADDDEETSH
jgi:hypothetical protein